MIAKSLARAFKADLPRMGDRVLLVEGIDDWHAIGNLLHAVTGQFPEYQLGYCDNDDGVLDSLAAITESSVKIQSILGAVIDADTCSSEKQDDSGVKTRIRSLQERLGKYYSIPNEFPNDGLILLPSDASQVARLPILGIWLMPDNTRDGIFEDLLRAAMTTESESYVCAVVDKARTDQMASFRDVERSKVVVKTHIAWQDPNKKNLGEAIGSHFENLGTATQPFVHWLARLFQTGTDS